MSFAAVVYCYSSAIIKGQEAYPAAIENTSLYSLKNGVSGITFKLSYSPILSSADAAKPLDPCCIQHWICTGRRSPQGMGTILSLPLVKLHPAQGGYPSPAS